MRKTSKLVHEFVDEIPDDLAADRLYITLAFDTMAHLCACGCGQEIVTPLSPTDWSFSYNGESVSVHPSIGNWSHACRSHYVIRHGRIRWAGDWTDEQVAAGRARDRSAKARQFDELPAQTDQSPRQSPNTQTSSWLQRLKAWVDGK